MKKYQDVVLNSLGQPVAGASVSVTKYPSGETATIYSDNGVTTTSNPVTTDSLGTFSFYAEDGRYTLTISGTGIVGKTVSDVLVEDTGTALSGADDPTYAATNVSAINTALEAGGHVRISGAPGSTYYIDSAIIVRSYTYLFIDPKITIKRKAATAGTGENMIVNYAYDTPNAATVTLTWSSGVEVSVAWTAHGRSVGDAIWLDGASESEFRGVFIVKSVTNANAFKIDLYRTGSGSPTGTITAGVADRDIVIDAQCLFDANYPSSEPADNAIHTAVFGRAYNLHIRSLRGTANQKYLCEAAMLKTCVFEHLEGVNGDSDVMKLYGPAHNVVIRDISGFPRDDMMSLQCREPDEFAQYRWTWGDIMDVTVDGVYGLQTDTGAASSAISLYATDNCKMDRIRIRNVHGFDNIGVLGPIVWLTCPDNTTSNIGAVDIEGVTGRSLLSGLDGGIAIWPNGASATLNVDRVTIRNVRVHMTAGTAVLAGSGAVIGTLEIDGLDVDIPTSNTTGYGACAVSAATIDHLIIRNARASVVPTSGSKPQILGSGSDTATTNVKNVLIENCYMSSSNGNAVAQLLNGRWDRVTMRNNYFKNVSHVLQATTITATLDVILQNNYVDTCSTGVNVTSTSRTINVLLTGNNISQTGDNYGVLRPEANNTQVWNVTGTGNVISGPLVTRVGGTEKVRIKSIDLQEDVTKLDRVDGCMVYNNNSGAGTLGATGVIYCRGTGAGSWKHIDGTAGSY